MSFAMPSSQTTLATMFSEEVIAEMGSGVDADGFAADHNLTAREREVFELMLRGRDAKSIGEALVISRQHCEGAYPAASTPRRACTRVRSSSTPPSM